MSGTEVFLATTAAAAVASTVGTITGAASEAEAARQNAALKEAQAAELLSRQSINEEILREKSQYEQLGHAADFASTGREGAGIGGILRMRKDLEKNIINSRRDAEFKARMLRAGANIDLSLASDTMTAGWITGVGNLLNRGADAYKTVKGPKKSDDLY